jgi:hypothetical protein
MKLSLSGMPWAVQIGVLSLAAFTIVACERRLDSSSATSQQRVASSSAVLIGTPPAPPTTPADSPPETTPLPAGTQLTAEPKLAETAQTTSSAASSQELTKGEEVRSMPLPGQPNDHSSVAPDASQRAGQANPQAMPERGGQQDSPQREGQAATQ